MILIMVLASMFLGACVRDGTVSATKSVGAFRAPQSAPEPDAVNLELTGLAWLAPGADAVAFYTRQPAECLAPPSYGNANANVRESEQYLVDLGRAAFNSPLLFGGPAARGGLSCNSCHRGGRDNPDFFLAGLSDAPGTADVTSAMLSKSRGDGVFNPAPIPDLVGAGAKSSFGTRAPAPSLHAFIENAIIDEFQGAPPPAPIVAGLATYIEHLDPGACTGEASEITLSKDLNNVREMLLLAQTALEKDDVLTADFVILSAQNRLGRIHERFVGDGLESARADLIGASRMLAAIRPIILIDTYQANKKLAAMQRTISALRKRLAVYEAVSLYDYSQLTRVLIETGLAQRAAAP